MSSQEQINKLTIRHVSRIKEKRHWIAGASAMAIATGLLVTSFLNTQLNDKANTSVTPAHVTKSHTALVQNYAQLPLRFEQNQGQSANEVSFMSRGSGYTLFLTPTETVLTLQDKNNGNKASAVVRTLFVDANIPAEFNGNNALPGKVNYLIGRDKNNWLTNVPTYSDVIAREIYSGIDLRYHGDQRQLEYDFIVSPEGNAADIKMHFTGVDLLSINEKGQLAIETSQGLLHHKKPIVYQDIDGERIFIDSNYVLADSNTVSFELGDYDKSHDLVIDPILVYSTYLGGDSDDRGLAITVDDDGNAYIAGTTISTTFPTVNAYQTSLSGSRDTFIAKLNAAGDTLIYSTYFGGSGDEDADDDDDFEDEAGEDDEDDNDEGDSDSDTGKDIAVDQNGNLYITGSTNSNTDFPIVNAIQSNYGGGDRDAYIAKLSADGSNLLFSSYLGGSKKEKGFGIALDSSNNVFVTGRTNSNNFPVANAYQSTLAGNSDAFISKLSEDGLTMHYSSYFGGSKADVAKAIAVDGLGNATIAGVTKSKNNLPLQNALQSSFGGGGRDAFVTQLNSDGSALNYSTYLGGSKKDKARGITVDSSGNAIVVGMTKSKNNFPLVSALQGSYGGGSDDGFISKLNASGNALIFSTYIGGSKTDKVNSVAVDSNDDIYVIGTTKSTSGIPVVDAVQQNLDGSKRDAFITKLNPNGDTVIYSTYLGGDKNDRGKDIAVNGQDAFITGITKSNTDFPINNAVQNSFGGGAMDAFIAKIGSGNQAPVITSTPITTGTENQAYTYTVVATDANNDDLEYSLTTSPVGMTIDAQTGVINWLADVVGDSTVEVKVDDGNGGTDTQSYTLTIVADNQAPSITSTAITEAFTHQLYSYDVEATDPDNDTLTYSLQIFPTGMVIDGTTGLITWTPEAIANVNVTVQVDDGNNNTNSQSFIINVTDITPPEVTPPADITVEATGPTTDVTLGVATAVDQIDGALTPTADNTGQFAVGTHIVTWSATDASGNEGSATQTITVTDTTAPVVTPPTDITIEATGATTDVTLGAATANDLVDGALIPTADNTGPFAVGVHIIIWSVTDTAGNEGSATQTVTVTDTTPPEVTPPADITIEATGATTDVTLGAATATDLVDGALTPTADNTGPFAVGIHTVTWSVTDAAGNEGTATQTVTVTDTTAPVVTPPADITIEATGPTTDVTLGTATANDLVDGALTPAADNTGPFAVGTHTIIWSVTDAAGNEGTATQTVTVTDTTAPIVTPPANITVEATGPITTVSLGTATAADLVDGALTPAANNTGPFALGSHTITWSVTDAAGNTGSATQTVIVRDTTAPLVTAPADITVESTGEFTTVVLGVATATDTVDGVLTPLPDNVGPYPLGDTIITWSAIDSSVNTGFDTQTVTVIDTTPPIVTITSPGNGSFTNVSSQTITGTLNEPANVTVNGQAATVNGLNFSFGPVTLAEGLNTFNVVATDPSNNASLASTSVTLDSVAPIITLTSPEDNTLTNQTDVNFIGSVSEVVNTITIAGQTITQSADLSFDATATIAEGTQVIDIIATDLAGNNDTVSVTVTVDTTPPATPNTALINRSNPANGIVMVTGLAGSVEAGSLVHVLNPSNNFEAFEVVQSDGSFTAEVPAFANDNLSIFAVDAAGNSSTVSIIAPATTPELNLNAIGDKVAPLGQITRFTVTATDSSGEQIELGVTPLPLPDNMEYNIVTGELSFQPTSDQAGNYQLTFSAENVDERITETITVTVPAADPNEPTVFTGRVLDANSMEEGNIVPIVGATISFLDSGVVTTTDNQGYFTLNNLPLTAATFDIDGSTAQPGPGGALYASFREGLPLVSNVTNLVERPFYMPRLSTESLTTIDPLQETTVTNPTLGIDLIVAPGTAINDSDGTPFTGQMSISEVPRDLAPANLPEFMDPDLLITIQPVGVSYTVPAPITFNNTQGYAPNSEVDIWSVDPDLGQFVIVGTGRVTADGSRIETIAGGIVANDWHAPLGPDADDEGNEGNPDPGNPCPTCPEEDLTSTVSLNDGHMGTKFTLPAYRSLEASRALTFSYKTFRANPQPSVMFNGAINVRSTVPGTVSYELEVAGLEQGEEVFIDTSGFSESLTEAFSTAITFDAADFASGMYDYRLKVTSNFTSGTSRSRFVDGRIMVVNEQQSAFGAGWMLEGLYRLAFNPEDDDSVTLISPDGRSITYRESGVPGEYDEPDNDYAIFAKNPDGTYTHTEKDGIKMQFDAEGFITSHVDRNGNTTSYAYDAEGKLETITDPVGLITTLAYDNNGYLTTVTDPAERVSTFEYDPVGNLIQITYPDSTFQTFEYDDRHLMTAHEDENENRFTNRYDAFGRVIDGTLPDGTIRAGVGRQSAALVDVNSGVGTEANPAPVVRPDAVNGGYVDGRGNPSSKELDSHGRVTMEMDEIGRVTEHVRDTDSNPTQTTRPIGSVVSRTFDTFGNVLTQTEEFNSATTTYTYDSFSLVTSVKNPRNHTTTINRDPVNGNPLTIVNELGHTTTMTYDSRGLVETMTSPNGLVTTYTYNDEGLMETKTETPPVTSPGNVRLWSYSYYPTGLLQTVNTPDGITLTYTYDDRSMLTSVTDNLNQSIIYTYDDHKNVTRTETRSSDGSLALLVDSIYDNRNRLTHTKAPHVGVEESITQRILDPNSNLIGIIDPNGNASSNTYDEFNRLETNTHRENGVTDYTYDDQDRITQVIAPNGVTTTYEYDIISRRTKEISPDRGTISYTYDIANNVSTITEGRGITATMTYDALERVSSKVYPNTIIGKTENVSYGYDSCNFGLGYLCSRTDESGSTSYNYDAYGNLTNTSFTEIEGTNYTTSYDYDDGDNLIQMTMPSGRIVDYTRDGVRRINGIDTTLNGNAQNIVSNIQYRGDNQMLSCTFGNGTTDTRSYDLQGRLLTQTLEDSLNTIIDQRTYTYDKNSNVLSIDTNLEDNDYSYDKLDRITSDQINTDSPIDYSYDQNDNRLTKLAQDASIDELFDYVTNSNRILATDALRTAVTPPPVIPNRDMVYNDVGRLYQLIEEGTLKAEYIYNDAGQRTRKTNYQSDGITVDSITVYHYDQMGYLISETDEQGNLIKDYIWQEGMTPVAQIDNNAGTESIVYLYTDHLMTNRLATDDTQSIVWRWEGEAFGNTPAEELAGTTINLRFPGQYYDQETNLHYNHFRYYDSSIGRYITSDPVGLGGGYNTYNYVSSNPTNYEDRLGLFNPYLYIYNLGCKAANLFFGDERKKWDENVRDAYRHNQDIYDGVYERGIAACIEAYQYHKSKCKLEECIANVSDNYSKQSEENRKFLRDGLDRNPFNNIPECPRLREPKKPKDWPKPKPR